MYDVIGQYLSTLAETASVWGLVFVFVFMAIESSFIPFPSEVVMIPAGFFAARGELGFTPIVALILANVVAVVGSLLGAYVNYALGLYIGRPFLEKYGKYFFIKPPVLNRACELFNRYGAVTTFFCRLLPVIRQIISIPAGLTRMPFGQFTLFTALGAGIWSLLLSIVGYFIARQLGDISYTDLILKGKTLVMENLPYVLLGAIGLIALYGLVSRLVLGKKTSKLQMEEKK